MLFFCQFLSLQTSLLAGALTLVIMNLPTIMRTTQESLKTVPQSYREGAFGLGAGKWRVIRTVVLPGCIDGVVTGCILSVGRIIGESAALLFTAGLAHARRFTGRRLPFVFVVAGYTRTAPGHRQPQRHRQHRNQPLPPASPFLLLSHIARPPLHL